MAAVVLDVGSAGAAVLGREVGVSGRSFEEGSGLSAAQLERARARATVRRIGLRMPACCPRRPAYRIDLAQFGQTERGRRSGSPQGGFET